MNVFSSKKKSFTQKYFQLNYLNSCEIKTRAMGGTFSHKYLPGGHEKKPHCYHAIVIDTM